MALHQFAHEFFTLLGSTGLGTRSRRHPEQGVERTLGTSGYHLRRPPMFHRRKHAQFTGRFRRAVAVVDFKASQNKSIGGHAFPGFLRKKGALIVPTVSFDEDRTKAMLKTCKAHGVSISAALFALCNVVWARMHPDGVELPM
jgi:hypothetical protein